MSWTEVWFTVGVITYFAVVFVFGFLCGFGTRLESDHLRQRREQRAAEWRPSDYDDAA